MHKLENKTSEKARMARPTVQDVGRNKTARRQQGWAFPASSGDVSLSFPRAPWECSVRRAAPRITISVWRIRDAARPALHSHAARGNERLLRGFPSSSLGTSSTRATIARLLIP